MKPIIKALIIVVVVVSIGLTYYKTVIHKDFAIIDESSVEEE